MEMGSGREDGMKKMMGIDDGEDERAEMEMMVGFLCAGMREDGDGKDGGCASVMVMVARWRRGSGEVCASREIGTRGYRKRLKREGVLRPGTLLPRSRGLSRLFIHVMGERSGPGLGLRTGWVQVRWVWFNFEDGFDLGLGLVLMRWSQAAVWFILRFGQMGWIWVCTLWLLNLASNHFLRTDAPKFLPTLTSDF